MSEKQPPHINETERRERPDYDRTTLFAGKFLRTLAEGKHRISPDILKCLQEMMVASPEQRQEIAMSNPFASSNYGERNAIELIGAFGNGGDLPQGIADSILRASAETLSAPATEQLAAAETEPAAKKGEGKARKILNKAGHRAALHIKEAIQADKDLSNILLNEGGEELKERSAKAKNRYLKRAGTIAAHIMQNAVTDYPARYYNSVWADAESQTQEGGEQQGRFPTIVTSDYLVGMTEDEAKATVAKVEKVIKTKFKPESFNGIYTIVFSHDHPGQAQLQDRHLYLDPEMSEDDLLGAIGNAIFDREPGLDNSAFEAPDAAAQEHLRFIQAQDGKETIDYIRNTVNAHSVLIDEERLTYEELGRDMLSKLRDVRDVLLTKPKEFLKDKAIIFMKAPGSTEAVVESGKILYINLDAKSNDLMSALLALGKTQDRANAGPEVPLAPAPEHIDREFQDAEKAKKAIDLMRIHLKADSIELDEHLLSYEELGQRLDRLGYIADPLQTVPKAVEGRDIIFKKDPPDSKTAVEEAGRTLYINFDANLLDITDAISALVGDKTAARPEQPAAEDSSPESRRIKEAKQGLDDIRAAFPGHEISFDQETLSDEELDTMIGTRIKLGVVRKELGHVAAAIKDKSIIFVKIPDSDEALKQADHALYINLNARVSNLASAIEALVSKDQGLNENETPAETLPEPTTAPEPVAAVEAASEFEPAQIEMSAEEARTEKEFKAFEAELNAKARRDFSLPGVGIDTEKYILGYKENLLALAEAVAEPEISKLLGETPVGITSVSSVALFLGSRSSMEAGQIKRIPEITIGYNVKPEQIIAFIREKFKPEDEIADQSQELTQDLEQLFPGIKVQMSHGQVSVAPEAHQAILAMLSKHKEKLAGRLQTIDLLPNGFDNDVSYAGSMVDVNVTNYEPLKQMLEASSPQVYDEKERAE